MKFDNKIGALLLAFLFGLMVLASYTRGVLAHAQVTTSVAVQPQTALCFTPAYNMRYGASDFSSNGAVTELQSFLSAQGYFNSAYLGTGHFGSITLRAVVQFQAAHGLPSTGYFGPMTRALIQQITCGTTTVSPVSSAATLYFINPTSGAVGITVSITGFGFTSSNTVLMDGSVAATNIPITSSRAIACTTNPSCHGGINQTITFTVPSALSPNCPSGSMCPMYLRQVTPATYAITVQNSNGTSNTLSFTVTSGTSAQPLSVTGLDTPATLFIGQTGTWTVHVNTSSTNTNLHYGVVWGDEAALGTLAVAAQPVSAQSSATFMHIYSRAGTYTPVFTVTDDSGASVSTSNTILVRAGY